MPYFGMYHRLLPAMPFKYLIWLVTWGLIMLLIACSQDPSAEKDKEQESPHGAFMVAMLLPGPVDDQSWNATGYNALQRAKEKLGATVDYTENVAEEEMESLFERYAREGYDLVIGHGGQFIAAAEQAAKRFPRTNFMVVGTDAGNNVNLGTVQFSQEELGFLAGAVAGLKTRSRKVAYISGKPYAHMNEKGASFVAGARYTNPSVQALSLTIDTWSDTEKGVMCGRRLIEEGFDVLAVDADSAGLPIHKLAGKASINTIGWAADQYELAENAILTSGVQRAEVAILAGTELVRLGRWEGKLYKFGIKDGAQNLAPFRGKLDTKQQATIVRLQKDILEGRIDPISLTPTLEVALCSSAVLP